MYCSTCGTLVPTGRQTCSACGAAVAGRALSRQRAAVTNERHPQALVQTNVCPRCRYQGEGINHFSRGSRIAALIGITMVTMGAMGAGGLIYYFVRRDHLVCPRCGKGWGVDGERAVERVGRGGREMVAADPVLASGSWKQGWAIFLFIAAALMIVAGLLAGEVGLIAGSLLAAGGGAVLAQAASRDRERRREALISSLQLPVLKLAAEQGGRLTVTEVAAHLGWPLRRAERILWSLDDGIRVDSEVTDEGVIVYEFRELGRSATSASDLRLREGGS
ncbi:MAG: zinc ribbon domain-containing protein [Gemmatimonadetes bacterium]|nr:zinc ribbon domain-containing protein [Gemmatimonadota bacterium]